MSFPDIGGPITAHHPEVAAQAYAPYAPKISTDELAALLATHADHIHPIGDDYRHQIALYADELKAVHVLKPSTDPVKFANKVYADVIA
ncbi:MAG: hypothetical protein JO001_25025 [Alphaproteobacteria bacterium]|nr:hypothetical protein [Alphaproteobacteria bacterium]